MRHDIGWFKVNIAFFDLHHFSGEANDLAREERMHVTTSGDESNNIPNLDFYTTKVFHGLDVLMRVRIFSLWLQFLFAYWIALQDGNLPTVT